MTTDLTAQEIDELKRLEKAATEGEWEVFDSDTTFIVGISHEPTVVRPNIVDWPGFDTCGLPISKQKANARLIAASRNALPRIMAMVERLQVEVTAERLSTEGETELAKHYMDELATLRRQIAEKDAVINDLRSDLKTRIDDVRNIAARYRDETGLDPFGDK